MGWQNEAYGEAWALSQILPCENQAASLVGGHMTIPASDCVFDLH